MYFSSFAKNSKLKFDQDSKACWSFCFEVKVLNESKFSMPWVRCAFDNASWPILWPFFLEFTETLYETKSFQSITCISLENDISIARTFFGTKILETDTKTFFKTKIFETDTETFFETKYFWDRYRDFFLD